MYTLKKKNLVTHGFTLIELLVVISIIGLLSAVVLGSLSTARMKANDARRMSDLGQIRRALELHFSSYNTYPVGTFDSRQAAQWATFSSSLAPFMPFVPVDPKNGAGEGQICNSCGEYYYRSTDDGKGFVLSTYLAVGGGLATGANQYGPYFSVTSGCRSSTFWVCTQ